MISIRDLEQFRDAGLCSDGLDVAIDALGESTIFPTFRAMAEAYLEVEGYRFINHVVQTAALLAPGEVDGWKLARCMFFNLPKPIKRYATILGPDNWKEALGELRAERRWFEMRAVERSLSLLEEPNGWSECDVLANIAVETCDVSVTTVHRMLTLVCKAVDGS
jgi:hypothetical protein